MPRPYARPRADPLVVRVHDGREVVVGYHRRRRRAADAHKLAARGRRDAAARHRCGAAAGVRHQRNVA
eukprot:353961-Chlamydomonas_euryale.AAC.5